MKSKVLIIDDSENIVYTLSEICDYANYDCVTAMNGKEGLQLLLSEEPDLVLVDFHMPVMDGLLFLKTMRQMDKETPIIILTVDESQEVADKFLSAGASDFALKPIKAPDIIARMQVHLKMASLKEKHLDDAHSSDTGVVKDDISSYVTKGIAKGTLQIIADYLQSRTSPVTLEEISEDTGISYPTVHRYLNHLVNEDAVEIEVVYGNIGRPKNHYYWKKIK